MSDHGAIRIELECQVLCAALRRSWVIKDLEGHVKSCSQLSQLFPDLVTDVGGNVSGEKPHNYYNLLDVDYSVSPSKVVVAYFIAAKKFLREHNPRQKRQEYYELINAGFVLRKPRLRLSHDMIVSRADLVEQQVIHADGNFEPLVSFAPPAAVQEAAPVAPVATPAQQIPQQAGQPITPPAQQIPQTAQQTPQQIPQQPARPLPPVQIGQSGQYVQPVPGQPAQILPAGALPPAGGQPPASTPATAPASAPVSGQVPGPGQAPAAAAKPAEDRMPAVIELLKAARLIGPTEVLALKNQMRAFPEVSAVDLLLSAGYVTEAEMKSLQLGEFLLGQGKIDIGQFCVAMYDERMTGVKMAESLQSRGWLKPD